MKTDFHIVLNIKTAEGFESYGRFLIGNDLKFAYNLFSNLKGNEGIKEDDPLQLDLVETKDGLPVSIKVISCTLKELATNCKIITKEVFKRLNLEEMNS